MVTLQIEGGKNSKLRPGDIHGSLCSNPNISDQQIGKFKV
ncbi:hypothetical protein E2K93_15975 [Thalassotalea sp. HSM 43]|nr:DbpA RNA binding domain-containing protein [Thalassotalea sp. HSM 43]QBY05766.1 hypothetical protein E2K93_15975 [Thalassotalea sp. HSM 43]